MKKPLKILLIIIASILVIILIIIMVGMYKFNYLANKDGYDMDGNKIETVEDLIICDEAGNEYINEQEAKEAGLSEEQYRDCY